MPLHVKTMLANGDGLLDLRNEDGRSTLAGDGFDDRVVARGRSDRKGATTGAVECLLGSLGENEDRIILVFEGDCTLPTVDVLADGKELDGLLGRFFGRLLMKLSFNANGAERGKRGWWWSWGPVTNHDHGIEADAFHPLGDFAGDEAGGGAVGINVDVARDELLRRWREA